MQNLFDAVAHSKRGAHAADSKALAPIVAASLKSGDALLVKGSLGSGMRRIIDTLEAATTPPSTTTAGAG
jgi:UDP-N-acetylmuramoyl-tripeptide--D-alanyl-D-alanine ligase